jgi:chromosome partitioning protein
MRTIAFINQKGGVGKTTSTVNIGAGLAKLKKRVLLIDLDPQAHLTYSMGIQGHEAEHTVYDLLRGDAKAEQVIMDKYGMKIIPATLDLSGAEMEFSGIAGREFLLREALDGINEFDYILLDCPPSLGLLTLNGLTTANEVFIPLQAEFLALQGLTKLLETVEVVKKRLNKKLDITGVIGTRFDQRKKLNKEVISKVQEHFGDKVFKTMIRENIALAEAPSFGQTIFEYQANSYGAEDYLALSKEITKQ